MKANRILISCPQCGEQFSLLWREIKRNQNLTLTCRKCGLIHLALNAVILDTYNRLKKMCYRVGDPPIPEPIDPVRVFPGEDGTEFVIRRYKTKGTSLYSRNARKVRVPKED
jgi:hypothetical protein